MGVRDPDGIDDVDDQRRAFFSSGFAQNAPGRLDDVALGRGKDQGVERRNVEALGRERKGRENDASGRGPLEILGRHAAEVQARVDAPAATGLEERLAVRAAIAEQNDLAAGRVVRGDARHHEDVAIGVLGQGRDEGRETHLARALVVRDRDVRRVETRDLDLDVVAALALGLVRDVPQKPVEDALEAVLALGRRGQAEDVRRIGDEHGLGEDRRAHVVRLVDDGQAEALEGLRRVLAQRDRMNHRDHDIAALDLGLFLLEATDARRRHELRDALDPLVHEELLVDDDERLEPDVARDLQRTHGVVHDREIREEESMIGPHQSETVVVVD